MNVFDGDPAREPMAADPGPVAMDPAPVAADPGRVAMDPAPVRARIAAAMIDLLPVLALLVAVVCLVANGSPWWAPVAVAAVAVLWLGALWWGAAADGRTLGKRLLGLRVVDDRTGAAPAALTALERLVLRGALAAVTLGIAGLSYRWDPAGRERTWWDRIAGTRVVPGTMERGAHAAALARWAPGGPDDAAAQQTSFGAPGHQAYATVGADHPATRPAGSDVRDVAGAMRGWTPDVETASHPTTGVPRGSVGGDVQQRAGFPPEAGDGIEAMRSADFLPPPVIGGAGRPVPHESVTGDIYVGRTPALITGVGITGGAPARPARPTAPDAPSSPASGTLASSSSPAASLPPPAPGFSSPAAPSPPPAPLSPAPGLSSPAASSSSPAASSSSPAASSPSPSPAELPASAVRRPAADIVWDTGRHITLAGRVLIGRDPAPADGEHADHLLPVSTDSVGVSKTHLLLDIGPAGITVTDRSSTNGVRVARADGRSEICAPGEPVAVRRGDAVHFGGRFLTVAG